MQIASLDDAHTALANLVAEWKSGAVESPWHLQDTAEEIEEQLEVRGVLVREDPNGAGSIVAAALDLLANAASQCVLPRDIPAFEALLGSESGPRAASVERFRSYWEQIDYDARQADVERYWFSGRPHNKR